MNEQRVRKYHERHKGPFEVLIRKENEEIKFLKLCKYIKAQYKENVILTKMINSEKMKVVCINKETANLIPCDQNLNKIYKVYIPEVRVEVLGTIKLATSEDEKLLMEAVGKWKNPALPEVKILDVYRFISKKFMETGEMGESEENLVEEKSQIVKIVFPGSVLPDHIIYDSLLIPIREFKRAEMFCLRCKSYKHTQRYCNNKVRCSCGATDHSESECSTKLTNKCLHCEGDHITGDKNCPKRIVIKQKQEARGKIIKRKSFAEMLKEYVDEAKMPGEELEAEYSGWNAKDSNRKLPQKRAFTTAKKQNTEEQFTSPVKKRNKTKENAYEGPPPGFKKLNLSENSGESDPVKNFITDFINKLNINETWKQLIISLVVPVASQIVSVLKESIVSALSNGVLSNVL